MRLKRSVGANLSGRSAARTPNSRLEDTEKAAGATSGQGLEDAPGYWGIVGQSREAALAFYRQFVPAAGLAFDIGANIGNRVELFVEIGARVVAVEPQPRCARELATRFGSDPLVTVLAVGVAAMPGTARLRLATESTIASTSAEFIDATTNSGRFGAAHWIADSIDIRVTTLDHLIAVFGVPDFVKIDIEGAEPLALAGLTVEVPSLSFEFACELVDQAASCVERIAQFGSYRFALSEGESLELSPWVAADEVVTMLGRLPELAWGDIYARSDAFGSTRRHA